MKKIALACLLSFSFLVRPAFADADLNKMLENMDYVIRGHAHDMTVTLDVNTKNWKRHYKIHVWMKGVDYAFARVLEPSKVEGQGYLRIKARLWNYLPTAERTMLIPPSMMLDQFMGSDFSNDDFVKLSYLPRDYDAKLIGEETLDNYEALHLELTPHPDAPVTYEKLEVRMRKSDGGPLKLEFYNEKLQHIRTLHYEAYKKFGDHEAPSIWRMENHKDPDRATTVTIVDAKFDLEIDDAIFKRENLEKYP